MEQNRKEESCKSLVKGRFMSEKVCSFLYLCLKYSAERHLAVCRWGLNHRDAFTLRSASATHWCLEPRGLSYILVLVFLQVVLVTGL